MTNLREQVQTAQQLWRDGAAVTTDLNACAWLESRGLRPDILELHDAVRILPESSDRRYEWARRNGWRLMTPEICHLGQIYNLRLRSTEIDAKPKSRVAGKTSSDGLMMAGVLTRQIMAATPIGISPRGLVVLEGEVDLWSWLSQRDPEKPVGDEWAFVALGTGTWDPHLLPRMIEHHGTLDLVLRLDPDKHGDQIAKKIRRAAWGLDVRIWRRRPRGARDDNELLLDDELPHDPLDDVIQTSALQPPAERLERPASKMTPPNELDERTRKRRRAYVEGAYERATAKLTSGEGDRNDTLFEAAASTFRFTRSAYTDEGEWWDRFTSAAMAVGLEEKETRATLKSAARKAKNDPLPAWPDELEAREQSPSKTISHTAPPPPPAEVECEEAAPIRTEAPDLPPKPKPKPKRRQAVSIVAPLHTITEEIEKCLASSGVELFERDEELVEVRKPRGYGKTPSIQPVTRTRLAGLLSPRMNFLRPRGGQDMIPVHPPLEICDACLAMKHWPRLPYLHGLIETPPILPDGDVVTSPGFEPTTGLYYLPPDQPQLSIPNNPTLQDAQNAYAVLEELVGDWPFWDEHHQAAAIAYLITSCLRTAIEGPAPLTIIQASQPGAGKTYLATLAGHLAHGRSVSLLSQSTPDEMRKTILARAISRPTGLMILDNLTGELADPGLDAFLTADVYEGRVLGKSEVATIPNRLTLAATGNNLTIGGDLHRRILGVYLQTKTVSLKRRKWTHPDLHGHVRRHRGRYLSAIYTIASAHRREDCPASAPPMPSFQEWDRAVRSPLLWLGAPDPLQSGERVLQDNDSELARFHALLLSASQIFARDPFTIRDLYDFLDKDTAPLRVYKARIAGHVNGVESIARDLQHATEEALEQLEALEDGKQKRRRLGQLFATYKDRDIDGLELVKGKRSKRGYLWKIAKL